MSDYVGIVRSNERLTRAMNRLNILYKETKMLYDNSVLSLQLLSPKEGARGDFMAVAVDFHNQ